MLNIPVDNMLLKFNKVRFCVCFLCGMVHPRKSIFQEDVFQLKRYSPYIRIGSDKDIIFVNCEVFAFSIGSPLC